MNIAIGPGVNVEQLAASEAELRAEGQGTPACGLSKPKTKGKPAAPAKGGAEPVVVVASDKQAAAES